jgi:hypothetical protein
VSVNRTSDDEAGLHGLIGVAFADGEPALPDVDSLVRQIEALGSRIQRRQRVRTGISAAALCVTAVGMVVGIDVLSHSGASTSVVVPGDGGPSVSDNPLATDTGP